MCFKRVSRRATRDIVKHRRLDLNEHTRLEEPPDFGFRLADFHKAIAHFAIDGKVYVTVAVARLDIGKPMEFFRESSQNFG
jgi:hypothetical protein